MGNPGINVGYLWDTFVKVALPVFLTMSIGKFASEIRVVSRPHLACCKQCGERESTNRRVSTYIQKKLAGVSFNNRKYCKHLFTIFLHVPFFIAWFWWLQPCSHWAHTKPTLSQEKRRCTPTLRFLPSVWWDLWETSPNNQSAKSQSYQAIFTAKLLFTKQILFGAEALWPPHVKYRRWLVCVGK